MQTTLAAILAEHGTTYTAVAARANVQPRTVRQIAMGETPIDHVQVGTLRRIAAALGVPVAALLEAAAPQGQGRAMEGQIIDHVTIGVPETVQVFGQVRHPLVDP